MKKTLLAISMMTVYAVSGYSQNLNNEYEDSLKTLS